MTILITIGVSRKPQYSCLL